jgi:uncharacterized protein (TIGR03067 family)
MKRLFLLALVAGLFLVATGPAAKEGSSDKDKLQGSWGLVSVEVNKQPLTMDQLKAARLVVEGDRYSFTLGKTHLELTYKLDATKTPRRIDLTVLAGPQKGKTFHGIYKLRGDTYTVCRPIEPDKGRPTDFATEPDSGLMLVVWKHSKP